MIPTIRNEINSLLDNLLNEKEADFLLDLLDDTESRFQHLTVKRYPQPNGLSTKMHKIATETYSNMMPMEEDIFHIKGPMGTGL